MVSFQAPVSSNCVNKVPEHMEHSSNKRKIIIDEDQADQSLIKKLKPTLSLHSSTPGLDIRIESLLDTPLPVDWQQCLDIQSGKVHFYNTRTQTRTSRDPREASGSSELLPSSRRSRSLHMRLDLELNLVPCDHDHKENKNQTVNVPAKKVMTSIPSWLAYEGDEKSEMFATVCKRCFMLVMLCKASPSCPNCKFMHSSDHQTTTPHLFKRSSTLSQLLY